MKNKKVILTLVALLGISIIVGMTIAYSSNRSIFNNNFQLGEWKTIFTEEFQSPSNWMTCDTEPKTITVTNDADVDASIRIIIEEQWIDKDGNVLPVVSTNTHKRLAQINFTDNSGWTEKPGGYYYYDADLHEGETTSSLTTGVTLNCDANLDDDAEYGDATYHLKFTAQAIQADQKAAWHYSPNCESNLLYDSIACQTNGLDTDVDFTTEATASNNNGNGVNTFAAKSEEYYPVYYYRGEIENNYVIWGEKCWRAVRTTNNGGVKLIYNGVPTNGQCTTNEIYIKNNSSKYLFPYNRIRSNPGSWGEPAYYSSPVFSGYMYGDIIYNGQLAITVSENDNGPIFNVSNDIARNGNNYTLSGDVATINWKNSILEDTTRHYYICTDGKLSCESSKLGYITDIGKGRNGNNTYYNFFYLKIGGYDNIEAAKQAMFSNVNDSQIKTTVEGWFESQGLVNYENDLEDAIYCNDRTIAKGTLKSNNSTYFQIPPEGSYFTTTSAIRFGAYSRVIEKNTDGNYSPSLDCPNKNDSFTMSDTINGNGKLSHKIGLITEDEVVLAGTIYGSYPRTNPPGYLGKSKYWTMTPNMYSYFNESTNVAYLNNGTFWDYDRDMEYGGTYYVRPVVTLKAGMGYMAGADGTSTNPYVVE